MSECCSDESGGSATRRNVVLRAADGLALAASPTFAAMAVLTIVMDGRHSGMLGMSAHASPMSDMVMMYLLMGAFHLTAWLKLILAGAR